MVARRINPEFQSGCLNSFAEPGTRREVCFTKRGTVHSTIASAAELRQRIEIRFQTVGIDS
jgi:hypothetical protein